MNVLSKRGLLERPRSSRPRDRGGDRRVKDGGPAKASARSATAASII
jgi:hypothetical protein